MDAVVELKNLKKNYGKKTAVRDLNLTIPSGELFCLVGPNGAGKTTTLKMLVGLLKPTAGSIRVDGFDMVKHSREAKERISFVPDTPFVYEKLTPVELLRFVGKLYSLDPGEIREEGGKLLEFFQLAHVKDSLIEEFSHGMRQKAILAASLLHHPKVFILDEPMVGLDPVSIKAFKDLMRRKVQEGMTIIFSSHTLSMVEELAHRIAIINRGEMIALGTIQELRDKYRSKENLENMFMELVKQETR